MQQAKQLAAVRAQRQAFHALVDAAPVQRSARDLAHHEIDGARGVMRDEGVRQGELAVDLLVGIEVVEVRAVFVAHPTRAVLVGTFTPKSVVALLVGSRPVV